MRSRFQNEITGTGKTFVIGQGGRRLQLLFEAGLEGVETFRQISEFLARQRGVATLWTATEPDNAPALATYRAHGADTSETAVMVSIDVSLTD